MPHSTVSQSGMLSRLPGATNLSSSPTMMPAMMTPMIYTVGPVPCQNPHSGAALQVCRTGQHGMIATGTMRDRTPPVGLRESTRHRCPLGRPGRRLSPAFSGPRPKFRTVRTPTQSVRPQVPLAEAAPAGRLVRLPWVGSRVPGLAGGDHGVQATQSRRSPGAVSVFARELHHKGRGGAARGTRDSAAVGPEPGRCRNPRVSSEAA